MKRLALLLLGAVLAAGLMAGCTMEGDNKPVNTVNAPDPTNASGGASPSSGAPLPPPPGYQGSPPK